MAQPERFLALYDTHVGSERRSGHRIDLHDSRAIRVALKFAQDFKPHHIILGGDILDCGCISHHNHHKPGRTEGMRLLADAALCRDLVITPVEELASKSLTYITGNHCQWAEDLTDDIPALEGIVGIQPLLKLGTDWKIIPHGGYHRLGKLFFIHGDQISGGTNAARNAVEAYEQNVRLGHFHTYQVSTKTSAVDAKLGKTGVVIPCLCTKDPKYNEGKPNRWMQGFNFGYVDPSSGLFNDYVAIITDGRTVIHGKIYTG